MRRHRGAGVCLLLGAAIGATGVQRLRAAASSSDPDAERAIGRFEVGAAGVLAVGAFVPVVGAVACTLGAAQLIRESAQHRREHGSAPPVPLLVVTNLAVVGALLRGRALRP